MGRTGTWNENNIPTFPGSYHLLKMYAEERIAPGQKGNYAVIVTGDWGPVNELTYVKNSKKLRDLFGTNKEHSAYKLGEIALLGLPRKLYLYRMASSTAKQGKLDIKGTTGTESEETISLATKYATDRKLMVTITPSTSKDNAYNIIITENSKELITLFDITGTAENMVKQINNYRDNNYIVAETNSISTEDIKLNPISSQLLTNGSNGIEDLTIDDYVKALENIEKDKSINALSTGNFTGENYEDLTLTWLDENNSKGNKLILYIGTDDDVNINSVIKQANNINRPSVQLWASRHMRNGVFYSRAESAVYYGALDTGLDLRKSLGNKTTIFDEELEKYSIDEQDELYENGIMFTETDDGVVKTVDDKNTFTIYEGKENESLTTTRFVKFSNGVEEDTANALNRDYRSDLINIATDIDTTIAALGTYFDIYVDAKIIKPEYTIGVDDELQESAKKDELFWFYEVEYVDVVKKFLGKGIYR